MASVVRAIDWIPVAIVVAKMPAKDGRYAILGASNSHHKSQTHGMRQTRDVLKWLLGVLFMIAGANHFVHTPFYVSIMPPYLPWHTALVYVSGAAEFVLGAMLCSRGWERLAAWGLILLVIAVTPANLHMAFHAELYPQYNPVVLWLRLPLQVALIAWVYWYTRPPPV